MMYELKIFISDDRLIPVTQVYRCDSMEEVEQIKALYIRGAEHYSNDYVFKVKEIR